MIWLRLVLALLIVRTCLLPGIEDFVVRCQELPRVWREMREETK